MRESARSIVMLVQLAIRADRWRALGTLLGPISSLKLLLMGLWLKWLTDAVVAGESDGIIGAVAAMAVTQTLSYLVGITGINMRFTVSEKVGFVIDREIVRLAAGTPGLDHHERPEYQARLELLKQQHQVLSSSFSRMTDALTIVIGVGATVALLASVHPVLIGLVVLALPAVFVAAYRERCRATAEELSAQPSRTARHLRDLTTDRDAGMETRIFGLRTGLRQRLRSTWLAARRPHAVAERKAALASIVQNVGFGIGYAAATVFVLRQARDGHASAGDVVMAIVVGARVQFEIMYPVHRVAGFGEVTRAAARLLWLRDHAEEQRRDFGGDATVPATLRSGIELREVSFTYPGATVPSLSRVSAVVPAGGVVALVGENGSGKSTLVKILCRLYNPESGSVLVDGVPLRDIDSADWQQRLSAAFQDFVRPEFRARTSVGVGDLPHRDDDGAVRRALADAQADNLAASLPDGLETQLGAQWEGGVDLSTGQWQKVAVGRGLMRRDPILVAFDEPTASLDAPTEHALFESHIAAARTHAANGGVTLLVTHRFSTVRSADLILVLDRGRLVESGDHETLMSENGHYAELYRLQARSYEPPRSSGAER